MHDAAGASEHFAEIGSQIGGGGLQCRRLPARKQNAYAGAQNHRLRLDGERKRGKEKPGQNPPQLHREGILSPAAALFYSLNIETKKLKQK